MGQLTTTRPSVEIERRRFLIKKPLFDTAALELFPLQWLQPYTSHTILVVLVGLHSRPGVPAIHYVLCSIHTP